MRLDDLLQAMEVFRIDLVHLAQGGGAFGGDLSG
jgi:hypothetical protein